MGKQRGFPIFARRALLIPGPMGYNGFRLAQFANALRNAEVAEHGRVFIMSKFMRCAISLVFYLLPLSLLVLSACGGGGGGGVVFTPVPLFNFSGNLMVSTFSGTANPGADGTGAAARFNNPYSTVSDGTNLYVADANNHTIRKGTGAVDGIECLR
ncbi:MAG TPA: hypothetical protein VIY48_19680, partial [Candidatus Paceibacterota bacterium]